jgi:hypothetical protein
VNPAIRKNKAKDKKLCFSKNQHFIPKNERLKTDKSC